MPSPRDAVPLARTLLDDALAGRRPELAVDDPSMALVPRVLVAFVSSAQVLVFSPTLSDAERDQWRAQGALSKAQMNFLAAQAQFLSELSGRPLARDALQEAFLESTEHPSAFFFRSEPPVGPEQFAILVLELLDVSVSVAIRVSEVLGGTPHECTTEVFDLLETSLV